jgi:hypothetical protein
MPKRARRPSRRHEAESTVPPRDHLFRLIRSHTTAEDELFVARSAKPTAGGALAIWFHHKDGFAYQRYLNPTEWREVIEEPVDLSSPVPPE